MKVYKVAAPGRLAFAGGPARAVGGPSDNPLGQAWQGFIDSGVIVGQVALGVGLLGMALLIVLAQTSAGQAAGGLAGGAARRGLKAIPGVGVIA